MTAQTPRERFKESAEKAIQANVRNIDDRGVKGDRSALLVGANPHWPGLLDVLADAAEAAYGDGAEQARTAKGRH